MKFIDLHEDLVNYFGSDRRLLGMPQMQFSQAFPQIRHADIPAYSVTGTKVIICSLFPLTFRGGKCVAYKPKRVIAKQLITYRRIAKRQAVFTEIKNKVDLRRVLKSPDKIGLLLHMEGADAIRSVRDLARYYKLGVRSIGLTWDTSNHLASGTKGKGGLTPFGKDILGEMARLNMLLDLTHLNRKSFWQALKLYPGAIMASHVAARKLNSHPQNLTNAQITAIIKRDGVIGISFLPWLYGRRNLNKQDFINHLTYLKRHFGCNNLAIGTDFFGFALSEGIEGLNNITDLKQIFTELKTSGWKSNEIDRLFWRNAQRLISRSFNKASP